MMPTARWAYGQPPDALAEAWAVAGTTKALIAVKLRQGQILAEK